jgi:glucosylceramidase
MSFCWLRRLAPLLSALAGALLILTLAPALASAAGSISSVRVVLTDADLHQAALTPEPELTFSPRRLPRGEPVLDVDDHITYQTVIGFGAAMTDSAAWLIHNYLSPRRRATLLTQLFNPSSGLGLNFVRVPIGGSDFTSGESAYTYDDLPAGDTDPGLSDFSIAHDLSYVIPTLQQMLKANPAVDIISTEWTAPAWMKANDATSNLGRTGALLSSDYAVLAQYIVKFVQAYAAAGIPIWAVTPENEPGTPVSYPSMELTPAAEAVYVGADLAPAFASAGLTTRIYGGDTGAAEPSYAEATEADPFSAPAVSGEAWHCYGGQQGITAFHTLFPHVQDLMTECSQGIIPYTGAEAAIDAMRNWASTATLWNIALNPEGGPVQAPNTGCGHCSGLVTINEGLHTIKYNADYYQLGQLSKFVQRGAVRIDTPRWVQDYRSAGRYHVSSGLDNVAFLNPDGSRVLVAYNHSARPITFGVSWDDRQFSYTLDAGATVTFTWSGTEAHPATDPVSPCLNSGVQYATTGPGQISAEPLC